LNNNSIDLIVVIAMRRKQHPKCLLPTMKYPQILLIKVMLSVIMDFDI